jgi:hypothetical protein
MKCLQMTLFDEDQAAVEGEARLKVLEARHKQIRDVLKAAESVRNCRLENGEVYSLIFSVLFACTLV